MKIKVRIHIDCLRFYDSDESINESMLRNDNLLIYCMVCDMERYYL